MTPDTVVLVVGALVDLGGMAAGLVNDAQAALNQVTKPLGLISVTWLLIGAMVKSSVGRADTSDLWAIKVPLIALFLLGLANFLVDSAYTAGNQGAGSPPAVEASAGGD